ncbi:hypothetical protein PIB30_082710 [Stylosanthes scabra]|uniref:Uncharacterized protein n=1 Tax=Stylosanthes scabra TaxID=79078 RepID=A0ABU6UQV6_9FABA|nr:hypothetical protein [Stylosanthes scabra]
MWTLLQALKLSTSLVEQDSSDGGVGHVQRRQLLTGQHLHLASEESEGFDMLVVIVEKSRRNARESLSGFISFIHNASSTGDLLYLTCNSQLPVHLGLNRWPSSQTEHIPDVLGSTVPRMSSVLAPEGPAKIESFLHFIVLLRVRYFARKPECQFRGCQDEPGLKA